MRALAVASWQVPEEISSSVVAKVAQSGVAAWSDDAGADARFASSQSVVKF